MACASIICARNSHIHARTAEHHAHAVFRLMQLVHRFHVIKLSHTATTTTGAACNTVFP